MFKSAADLILEKSAVYTDLIHSPWMRKANGVAHTMSKPGKTGHCGKWYSEILRKHSESNSSAASVSCRCAVCFVFS